ncbi:MAG: type II toxin-antitoxin system VapC family toxin [Selenomonas sp.]|uniref:type II toxin-antitoxin system VapC family toxin n=1 Tax=Selenomonas sp. TaxID=2053611 RepID=UPI0025DBC8DE|nr:type II toxin-antitoxin system VapC family toxin [Selenomonas sp.]MCI6100984.1 type II toxin-antitoxin system VapC family toxin [Selenomonas sp.]MCI6232813.1 type II toxin-antitoxin system VapC family toxin [Selenomonas sp.]
MKYYLDTNIIIYALNGKYPAVMPHFQQVPSMSIVIPSTVLAEIEYGARKSRDYGRTIGLYRKFMDYFASEPFDELSAACYGRIRADLEQQGRVIGANDMMIAATVMAANGILVTHNTREFSRIGGLVVEDWTQG